MTQNITKPVIARKMENAKVNGISGIVGVDVGSGVCVWVGEAVGFAVVGIAVGVDVGIGDELGVGVGFCVNAKVAVILWKDWTLLKVYNVETDTAEPSTIKEATE